MLCRIGFGSNSSKLRCWIDLFWCWGDPIIASSKLFFFVGQHGWQADVMSKRNPHIFSNGQGSPCCFLYCISNLYLGIWGCLVSIKEITFGLPWLQRSFVVSSKNNILKSGGRPGKFCGKFRVTCDLSRAPMIRDTNSSWFYSCSSVTSQAWGY